MSEWRTGDLVGMRVDTEDSSGVRMLVGWDGYRKITASVSPAFIERLPPDPHQALKDAVIEAAKKYRAQAPCDNAWSTLRNAVDTLTAAQTPPKPDPVEVFTNAIRPARCVSICARYAAKLGPHCYGGGRECHDAIEAGLAAVDAARGAK